MLYDETVPRALGPENDDGAVEAVEVVARERRGQTVVQVRTLRSRAVLFAAAGADVAGAEFAAMCAERFCAERGLVLVMRPRRAA